MAIPTIDERMAALSKSTPQARERQAFTTQRVSEFAKAIEDADILELLQMPSGAFKRVLKHMIAVSAVDSQKAHTNSEVYRSEGLEHFPKYYREKAGLLDRKNSADLLPPVASPYLTEAKERVVRNEAATQFENQAG